MYLQVISVQEVRGKDTRRRLGAEWGQRGGFLSPHFSDCEVQPVHTVQPGLPLQCQVGGIHGRQGMVQDAGGAQHLTVQVIDQSQRTTGLHPQERLAGGAFEKVLQASAPGVTQVSSVFCGVRESPELGQHRGGRMRGVMAGRDGGR